MLALITEAVLAKINKLIVGSGHAILDKRVVAKLNVKTDSFVVEGHVHYPTDSNFYWMRCALLLTGLLNYATSTVYKVGDKVRIILSH